jgi:crossover junction endodeoxyribonuclease RusA
MIFSVAGLPIPQGSLKMANGNIIHVKDKELRAWRTDIGNTARNCGVEIIEKDRGAIIDLMFCMPKPSSVKRPIPSTRPDLDKLIRAVLDALTGIAYIDDGQVVEITASKIYSDYIGVKIGIEKV